MGAGIRVSRYQGCREDMGMRYAKVQGYRFVGMPMCRSAEFGNEKMWCSGVRVWERRRDVPGYEVRVTNKNREMRGKIWIVINEILIIKNIWCNLFLK